MVEPFPERCPAGSLYRVLWEHKLSLETFVDMLQKGASASRLLFPRRVRSHLSLRASNIHQDWALFVLRQAGAAHCELFRVFVRLLKSIVIVEKRKGRKRAEHLPTQELQDVIQTVERNRRSAFGAHALDRDNVQAHANVDQRLILLLPWPKKSATTIMHKIKTLFLSRNISMIRRLAQWHDWPRLRASLHTEAQSSLIFRYPIIGTVF